MTEKEIIKALEYCNHNHIWQKECFNCEYATFEGQCGNELIKDALKLINRQQAEIEELTDKHWNECRQIAEYDDESKLFAGISKLYSEIRTEAVKNFAEALKTELKNLSKVHLFGREFALVGDTFVNSFVEKYEKGSEENA